MQQSMQEDGIGGAGEAVQAGAQQDGANGGAEAHAGACETALQEQVISISTPPPPPRRLWPRRPARTPASLPAAAAVAAAAPAAPPVASAALAAEPEAADENHSRAACLTYALPEFLLRQIYLFVGIHFSALAWPDCVADLPDCMALSVVCGSQNRLVLWLLEESMTHVFYCRRCHAALVRSRRCCWCDGLLLSSAQRLQWSWRLRLRVVLAIMASRRLRRAD